MSDQTVPMKGGWVMIKRLLPTEIQVPLLSIFYAMPDRLFPKGWHTCPWSDFGYLKSSDLVPLYKWRNGSKALLPQEVEEARKLDDKGVEIDQRVRIMAPDGEVWIEPYEWTPIPDISVYFDAVGKGMILHEYTARGKQSSKMEDQIFYMQTRGLSRSECLRLLLGEVKKPNEIWLEADQELVDFFFGERDRKRTLREPMKVELRAEGHARA